MGLKPLNFQDWKAVSYNLALIFSEVIFFSDFNDYSPAPPNPHSFLSSIRCCTCRKKWVDFGVKMG
jgi:hypothetical protein